MPPECAYGNVQPSNHWRESLDHRYFPVHLNNFTAKARDDGSVRVVVAHENPGVDNWISTEGYENGHILVRTLLPETPMEAEFSVVKLADLRTG